MDLPPPPPVPEAGPPTVPLPPPPAFDDLAPTEPAPVAPIVLPSTPPTGLFGTASQRARETYESLHRHARAFGFAVMVSLPIAAVLFVVLGAIAFGFGDRGFWDTQVRLFVDYWYLYMTIVVAVAPLVFIEIRDGSTAASSYVLDRGYWKVLVAACVVLPLVVAVIVFVASHLVAVVITIVVVIAVLLLLVITVGGV